LKKNLSSREKKGRRQPFREKPTSPERRTFEGAKGKETTGSAELATHQRKKDRFPPQPTKRGGKKRTCEAKKDPPRTAEEKNWGAKLERRRHQGTKTWGRGGAGKCGKKEK